MKKIFLLLTLLIIGCTNSSSQDANVQNKFNALLSPVPADSKSIESQLLRYRGQTEFLSPYQMYRSLHDSVPVKDSPANKAKGGDRAIQESDIFKIGRSGSKLLYLLNNYRGLQVVSFSKGADQPELIGRVAPTGNYPDDMYFDEKNERLIVIERVWNQGDQYGYSTAQSRLVIYDVSKSTQPRISQTVEFEGETYDSRLVGDVLYTVGAIQPDYRNNNQALPTGVVQSFLLSQQKVNLIEKQNLSLPAVYSENMNIIETEFNGQIKYFMVAILSDQRWSWWGRNSLVEVVDITDSKGKIEPIMLVSAKGFILERTQTNIVNNTLIVTSNYSEPTQTTPNLRKVAVETFNLPTKQSVVISQSEADYRKLAIDRELNKVPAQDREALLEQLLKNPDLALKGVFVQTATGLKKLFSDSVITVGDTTGLSANLQDVRYSDGLLYAFWVPQNNIDPLDLFDISQPEKGVKYLGRLLFDGWISRAIPMTVQGRRFVLGLGFVIPAVNNPNNQRHAQAMVFEIIDQGGQPKAVEVASLTFKNADAWTNFNALDRYIEVRETSEGAGQVLFEMSQLIGNQYTEGGKILKFDLNKIVSNQNKKALEEGGLLVAESSWLRRVFTNPEISMINTFSDLNLGVFDTQNLNSATGVEKAIATLELARNIRTYHSLGKYGVQVISDYSWYWRANQNLETEIRVVSANTPDAEKKHTKVERLKGTYTDSLVRGKVLYVTTQEWQQIQDTNGNTTGSNLNRVYRLEINGQGGVLSTHSFEWLSSEKSINDPVDDVILNTKSVIRPWRIRQLKLVEGANGTLLVNDGFNLKRLYTQPSLKAEDLVVSGCNQKDRKDIEFITLGDKFYQLSNEVVLDPKRQNLSYARIFLAEANLNGNQMSCKLELNIPGRPITVDSRGYLLVDDKWIVDIIENRETWNNVESVWYSFNQKQGITSVKLQLAKASLVDQLEKRDDEQLSTQVAANGRLFVIRSEQQGNWYGAQFEHEFIDLALDNDGYITERIFSLNSEVKSVANIAGMWINPKNLNERVLLIRDWRTVQAYKVSLKGDRPQVVMMKAVDENGNISKEQEAITINGYLGYGENAVNFNPDLRTVEFASGYVGVQQYLLEL